MKDRLNHSIFHAAGAMLLLLMNAASGSPIKPDEEVHFFPSLADFDADKKSWNIHVQGLIYEPENPKRTVQMLRRMLEVENEPFTPAQQRIFGDRTRAFFADHEGNKKITVRLGGKTFNLDASGRNGHFHGIIRVSAEEWESMRAARLTPWINFHAVTREKDLRLFPGGALCLPAEGLSVISDIDDTIKKSEVTDRRALIRNTFFSPFEAIPGMAGVYQDWSTNQATQFHYVSASPWQLYEPLAHFVATNGFPRGTFHMRNFRWKDRSFLDFFRSPEAYKTEVLEPLLKRFPQRRFILVGDSGEFDPEIYGNLARKFPGQVAAILIREVTESLPDAERYQKAFRELPRNEWAVFKNPEEIRAIAARATAAGVESPSAATGGPGKIR